MFKNLKLGSQLMIGFSSVALIALILGIIGYYGVVKNGESINEIGLVRSLSVESTLDMEMAIHKLIRHIRNLLIPSLTIEDYERQYSGIIESRRKYQEAFKIYEPLPQVDEEREEWQSFVKIMPEWVAINDKIVQFHHEISQIGIFNPDELLSKLRQFRADHLQLELNVIRLIVSGAQFEGEKIIHLAILESG